MTRTIQFAVVALTLLAAANARASLVTFTDNPAQGFLDIRYTVSAGAEFTNWDLIVTPISGRLLDPNTAQRQAAQTPNPGIDTFANTVFSAAGAGNASYIFTEYNPGSAFPPVPADAPPSPTNSGAPGFPKSLNWSIFDTNTGDGNIAGFFPYLLARIAYEQPTTAWVTVKVFDTAHAGVGETFLGSIGIPSEPSSAAMTVIAMLTTTLVRRRRR